MALGFTWPEIFRFKYNKRDACLTDTIFEMLREWCNKWQRQQSLAGELNRTKCPEAAIDRAHQTAMEPTKLSHLLSGSLNDDLYLYRVGELVGKRWKDLGRQFGLAEGELEHIEVDNFQNSADAAMETLTRWRNASIGKPKYFSNFLRGLRNRFV